MARKITVTIQADITLETTKRMEEIIKAYRSAENEDDWDICCELENILEELLSDKISKEIKGIKNVEVLDTDW